MAKEKSSQETPPRSSSINEMEVDKFARMAQEWWDPNGKFKPLHKIGPVRLAYIRDEVCRNFNIDEGKLRPLAGLQVLDVGCGGGLLCEPMARLGAQVTGADVASESIKIAKHHADEHGLDITYLDISAEELAERGEKYDVVLNMEVVEHVQHVDQFIATCASLLKPEGIMLLSTLNRTLKSFALGIVTAEYILGWLPKGTHHWEKFITPDELSKMIEAAGLRANNPVGVVYNPITDSWSRSSDTDVNYMLSALQN